MTKHRKRILLIALALAGAAGGGVAWYLLSGEAAHPPSQDAPRQPRPVQVEVESVRRGRIARRLNVSGEVVAADSVVIAATKEGPIVYCPWREGDAVTAGERLVEIDREVHRSEVLAAQAALAVAQARLADLEAGARPEEVQKAQANVQRWRATFAEARANHERQAQLIAEDFTSQQSVDQARERMLVAEAELAAARNTLDMLQAGPTQTQIAVQASAVQEAAARLALAEAHMAECLITAPFDGVIAAVHVRPGHLATPRSPLLEMYAPDSLVIRFTVPEAQAVAAAEGTEIDVTLDAFPDQRLKGHIVRVYPKLDRTLRTRTVEAEIIEGVEPLPGMFARIALELDTVEDTVLAPKHAIFEHNGESSVFVFDKNQIHLRPVAVGITDGRNAQIVQGLDEGEAVVTTMQHNLRHGAPARIRTAAAHEASQSPATGRDRGDGARGPNRGGSGAGR